jgi:glycerophosphoryl diester phosphodiesterase
MTDHETRTEVNTPAPGLEIQGHRGARGLFPENTVAGFVMAVREGADVLEMDLCISGDGNVIVSHEPWMSHEICSTPDGEPIAKEEERKFNLHAMTVKEIADFDCGSRPHPRFPDQRNLPLHKPTLAEVVAVIKTVPTLRDNFTMRYNLEIKHAAELEPEFCPDPETFARMVLDEVKRLGIAEYTCIQSFSAPALEAVHALDPGMTTAWLVESEGSVASQLERLSFTPDIYSPNWRLIDAEDVHALQAMGLRVIPWTVNEPADLMAVMQMGVDGIITDYPDRLYSMR